MEKKTKEFNLESMAKVINEDDKSNIFKVPNAELELPLRIKTFPSSKEYEQFIKNVEKLVRISQEYRLWTHYIIDQLGYSKCEFTKETVNECPVVVHHHPIPLYTITKGVLNHYLTKELEFSTFDVATKVIELHFQNKVGFVVMLSDLHSKYHNGFLNIPIEFVHGQYKYILQNYTMDEVEYDRICKLCNIHIEDLKQTWTKDNYIGVNEYELPKSLPEKKETKLIA